MAERGIDVTYETVRCWADKFGGLRRQYPQGPQPRRLRLTSRRDGSSHPWQKDVYVARRRP